MTREKYPLAFGLASVVMTALGLSAAALGVQWGAAPPPGDALRYAWVYVHVMWMLMWLVVWPAMALRPVGGKGGVLRADCAWEWAAILAGGIPAVAVAGFLSGATVPMIAVMLALQVGASLLVLGVLAVHGRLPRVVQGLAALLAALTVAGPVAAFLWVEFFPLAWRGWLWALPLVAVGRAARSPAEVGGDSAILLLWWIAGIQVVAGCLLYLAGASGQQTP